MEMFAYNFMRICAGIGATVVAFGAAIAILRRRLPAISLQLVGALCFFASHVMSWLPLVHPEGRRIAPAWVFRCEEMLTGGGLLLFAVGYAWYWLGRQSKQGS